ncbi:hypothetical protein C8R44DRAFT_728675 [Mycena epipterygia]|nr:hypothetical protein C8R44DRAFT_728675 [Mycena epipterygia]
MSMHEIVDLKNHDNMVSMPSATASHGMPLLAVLLLATVRQSGSTIFHRLPSVPSSLRGPHHTGDPRSCPRRSTTRPFASVVQIHEPQMSRRATRPLEMLSTAWAIYSGQEDERMGRAMGRSCEKTHGYVATPPARAPAQRTSTNSIAPSSAFCVCTPNILRWSPFPVIVLSASVRSASPHLGRPHPSEMCGGWGRGAQIALQSTSVPLTTHEPPWRRGPPSSRPRVVEGSAIPCCWGGSEGNKRETCIDSGGSSRGSGFHIGSACNGSTPPPAGRVLSAMDSVREPE